MNGIFMAAAILVAALCAMPASAQNADGRLLTSACATCHAPGGKSTGAMPAINGRNEAQLRDALREFRDDRRPSTVMNRLTKGYTDAEIETIARDVSANWK